MLKAILLLAGATGVLAVPVSSDADGGPPDLEIGCPKDLEPWNHGCRVRTNNTVDAAGGTPPPDPDVCNTPPRCKITDHWFHCLKDLAERIGCPKYTPTSSPTPPTIPTSIVITTTVTTVTITGPTPTSPARTTTVTKTDPSKTSTLHPTTSTTVVPPKTSASEPSAPGTSSSIFTSSRSSSDSETTKASSQSQPSRSSFSKTTSSNDSTFTLPSSSSVVTTISSRTTATEMPTSSQGQTSSSSTVTRSSSRVTYTGTPTPSSILTSSSSMVTQSSSRVKYTGTSKSSSILTSSASTVNGTSSHGTSTWSFTSSIPLPSSPHSTINGTSTYTTRTGSSTMSPSWPTSLSSSTSLPWTSTHETSSGISTRSSQSLTYSSPLSSTSLPWTSTHETSSGVSTQSSQSLTYSSPLSSSSVTGTSTQNTHPGSTATSSQSLKTSSSSPNVPSKTSSRGPGSSRPSSTNEPTTSSHSKTSSKSKSSTDEPTETSSRRKTTSTETSSVPKTSTQSITKTSTDTAPTAVPTDDPDRGVGDVVEVLDPEDDDDDDLALGLGLGLGLGIPGAGLLGWGATLAGKLAKDQGLFKFAKSFLKGSMKMNDDVLRSMAKLPKIGDFPPPPRPPYTPQPPPAPPPPAPAPPPPEQPPPAPPPPEQPPPDQPQPPPEQPPPDQPPPDQPQPPPEQPPPEQPPPEQPQPPKQPQPDSRVDRNALDYIKQWRSRLERKGLTAGQAAEVTNEFQSDMAITERAMAKSAAQSSPDMARKGGRPGGLQAARIQEAANLAAYGAGATVVSQSLARAGVPHPKIPKVLKDLKKTKIKKPGKADRHQAVKESTNVIARNSELEGAFTHEAAHSLAKGAEGRAIDHLLRGSGVSEENMSETLSDLGDAIRDADGDKDKAYWAAVNVINKAASLTSHSTLLSRRGIDEIGAEGAIDVMGASYMLWHGATQAMWDSVLAAEDERHSKIREEILALGPPPALTAWREFVYPYQRIDKVDDGDRNTTSSALPTSTSWSNSTVLPTSSFLPTSSALSSSFSFTTSTSLSTSTPLSKSAVLPTSSVLPSKTSEPTPTSTGKQPPDDPKQYPPGRQPCTAAPTALKERWAFLDEIKNGTTPEFRKETANRPWAYLSEVEYQIRALDDATFKPRAFEPWYTDKLRQNNDYRAKALELILFDRDQYKSLDDFRNRRDNYANLLRTHPDLYAKTANTMRTVMCEFQAALDGGEIPPGISRKRLWMRRNRRRALWKWLMSLKMA